MNNTDRDFKGVWISKEIWLNEELTALDKVIYTEISSLDNENHCTASNEYLAEFCQCSERKVSDTIKKLISMNLIEVISFDGRHRVLRVAKFSMQTRKICESAQKNLQSINIDISKSNKEVNNISKDILLEPNMYDDVSDKLYSEEKPKKKNLYDRCRELIAEYTQNPKLYDLLITYLKMRLEVKDKPLYYNMWKGMLDKLFYNMHGHIIDIVQQSIDKGWLSFYEVSGSPKKKDIQKVSSEFGVVSCDKADDEELLDVQF